VCGKVYGAPDHHTRPGRLIPVRSFHAEARRLIDRLEATTPATPNHMNAADGDHTMRGWRRPIANTDQSPPLPEPDGPVDPTVSATPIEEVRPGRFTLMAAGWMPPTQLVTQALGLCFTTDGLVVLVTMDGRQWTLPGGTVEDGESVEQALVREVAEEACARVVRCKYLASQHVADPLNPDGRPSYYQSRWWARVNLDPWQPQEEMTARRLVPPGQVLDTLSWQRKEIANRLLQLALDADLHDRAR
jgi:ADP-ribose pyrophosphatase YjhB (NUDIX family)